MFSIRCDYPCRKPPFSSRYHLSCPIMVYIMRLSPTKVSHFPLWHTSHYECLQADICRSLLFVVTEMVSYFLPSGGLHLIPSQITLSVCVVRSLFFPSSRCCWISHSSSVFSFVNFSPIFFLHISFIRLQCVRRVNVRWHSAAVCSI